MIYLFLIFLGVVVSAIGIALSHGLLLGVGIGGTIGILLVYLFYYRPRRPVTEKILRREQAEVDARRKQYENRPA